MNNYYPQNNTQYQYGYNYGAPRPKARNTQPLTQEQIAKLRHSSDDLIMKLDQEDMWRSACTHREKDGTSSIVHLDNGKERCTICGEEFKIVEPNSEEVKAAIETIVNMFQTAKLLYVDAPNDLIWQYFQILALIKKFPQIWDRALANFNKYDNIYSGNGVNYTNMYYPSSYNTLQALLTNPYGGYQPYAQQQPYMNNYQQMPMQQQQFYGYQQPMVNNMNPQMMDPNPMAYGAPSNMPAQAPMAPAPGVMPGVAQPAPVAAPIAENAPAAAPVQQQAEVQQQQVFNV